MLDWGFNAVLAQRDPPLYRFILPMGLRLNPSPLFGMQARRARGNAFETGSTERPTPRPQTERPGKRPGNPVRTRRAAEGPATL